MSEKIRVATLCSGYDSQCLALDRLKRDFPDFDYELMWWSDIDKYAIKAHDALFPQWADRNKGDMTKIEWDKCEPIELLFYSTPCQSISQAVDRNHINIYFNNEERKDLPTVVEEEKKDDLDEDERLTDEDFRM